MSKNIYESDEMLTRYVLFHYGSREEILPFDMGPESALDFLPRCVGFLLDGFSVSDKTRALDLGCAVGRASFELSRKCPEVVGIDASRQFIGAAQVIRSERELKYKIVNEGRLGAALSAVVPEGSRPDRVRFLEGNACDLSAEKGTFDLVLAANLIDRLPDPRRCLEHFKTLIRPGGRALICSPYTWMTEFTPEDKWLGGFQKDGKSVRTFDGIAEILDPDFELLGRRDMPFLIREHARKYQWSVADAGLWERK